jgi:hypothetical protein
MEMSEAFNIPITAADNPLEAVSDADVVCIASPLAQPIELSVLRSGGACNKYQGAGIVNDTSVRIVVPVRQGPETRPSGWDPRPNMAQHGGRDPQSIATTLQDIISHKNPARLSGGEKVLYEQRGTFSWDSAILLWGISVGA